jgi:hypothetical protein
MNDGFETRGRRSHRLPRPHPATVIALFALVMAMGGTSLAGSLISGSNLKNGTVSRNKIAKGAIDSTRLASGAISWKSLGAQVVAGPSVALPVSTSSQAIPITSTAACPAGTVAVSGGESISDPVNAFVIESVQAGSAGAAVGQPGAAPSGWTSIGANVGSGVVQMQVYAICIAAGA